jgi:hypothetical protein
MTVEIIGIGAPVPDLAQVTKTLAARAEHYDRTASFPADSIAAIHDAGLLTATVHERYGGRGAGLAETAAILRALGQGDPSAALVTAMTMFAHAMQGIEPSWPDDIYTAAVAEAAQRPVLVNALRVEPELGTPARGGLPATVARPDGDRWSLTGHKIFSTGAEGLRWMVVWARVGDTEEARGFLVRSDAPGISIQRTWDHLGLRASRSDDVLFAGTPAVPSAGTGGGPLFLAWNSLGLTSLYLGVADAGHAAPFPGGGRRDRRVAGYCRGAAARDRSAGRRGRPGRPSASTSGEAHRHAHCHRRGLSGGRAGRQQWPDQAQPARAAPARRAVRPRPHPAGRLDRRGGGPWRLPRPLANRGRTY